MSEAILTTIITSLVTLVSIFVSSKNSRDKMSIEMDKKIAVIDTKMEHMNDRIEEHNGYAKMFSENIPAIKQHMVDTDRRIEQIERRL